MSWSERYCLAVLIAVVLLLWVAPSRADEAISRRLVALRSIVDPEVALARVPAPGASVSSCGEHAWWNVGDYAVRSRSDRAVRDASIRFGVDRRLIHSLIRHESGFDPLAVSSKGAQGMMQLMPATARELGVSCPFDPRENILGGTRYLRRMRDRLGSWPRALAGYHAGPGRVESGRIPDVTRTYVERVMRSWRHTQPTGLARPALP